MPPPNPDVVVLFKIWLLVIVNVPLLPLATPPPELEPEELLESALFVIASVPPLLYMPPPADELTPCRTVNPSSVRLPVALTSKTR